MMHLPLQHLGMPDLDRTPSPAEIRAIREALGLLWGEFGEMLGVADAARVVRGWELGERNGHEYSPSGTAMKSLFYALSIDAAVHTENSAGALLRLAEILPKSRR